jgi:Fic family protein
MKSTGGVTNVTGGVFDSSKGDFRLCGIAAGYGGKSYMNCLKVPEKVSELCEELNIRLDKGETSRDFYDLSFDAHLNLVTVHPWIDGNGRMSHLLMNYIQFCHQLIPTKVYREDKSEYIAALIESRERESSLPFRNFMARQLLKTLKEETTNYRRSQNKRTAFMF